MVLADVALTLVMGIAALAVLLGVVWFLLPFMASRPCADCGRPMDPRAEACPTCGAPPPPPPTAHPHAAPYGFPADSPGAKASTGHMQRAVQVEEGVAYNRGLTRRVLTLATAAMGLGIGLRVVGMLGVLGLPQVPVFIDGLLTIVGGVVAFVGFVFLDAA